MALTYRIDPVRRIVTILGDYADAAGWRAVLGAIAADPEYQRGSSFLRDQRGGEHPVSPETVVEILAVIREFWERLGVHRAAVLTGRGSDDGPAMVAEALATSDEMPIRAFTDYEEALRWIQGP